MMGDKSLPLLSPEPQGFPPIVVPMRCDTHGLANLLRICSALPKSLVRAAKKLDEPSKLSGSSEIWEVDEELAA